MIFIFAMACRFFAWMCLTRMEEPFRHTAHDDYFSFLDFVKGMRSRNFARFVLFASLMNFCVSISGPLLAVFVLNDLHFDYRGYMVVVTTAALSGFVFQKMWGHAADRRGNMRMLKIAGWGISLMPIAWMFSHNLVYLFVVQVIAGAFWGGFNLLVLNFLMEATTPQKRIRCISYYNVTNSFAVFLGASLGGLLLHRLPPLAGYSYLSLFLLSCAGRILVMAFVSRRVKEAR
jgi:MFS family permease